MGFPAAARGSVCPQSQPSAIMPRCRAPLIATEQLGQSREFFLTCLQVFFSLELIQRVREMWQEAVLEAVPPCGRLLPFFPAVCGQEERRPCVSGGGGALKWLFFTGLGGRHPEMCVAPCAWTMIPVPFYASGCRSSHLPGCSCCEIPSTFMLCSMT